MGLPVKWEPNKDPRDKVTAALTIGRRVKEPPRLTNMEIERPAIRSAGLPPGFTKWSGKAMSATLRFQRVDLIRTCAKHEQLYGAGYIFSNGVWQLGPMIRITDDLHRLQYGHAAIEVCVVDGKWIGAEQCPWCGASGNGPIFCKYGCGRQMCRGLSSPGYFRCPCGFEGPTEHGEVGHTGVIPRLRLWL
jgi:hypothetical protein